MIKSHGIGLQNKILEVATSLNILGHNLIIIKSIMIWIYVMSTLDSMSLFEKADQINVHNNNS